MRARVWSTLALAALTAGCDAPAGLRLVISSRVDGIEALLVSTFAARGALTLDDRFSATLPGRVRIDANGRTGPLRISVWGTIADARVAFATTMVSLDADRDEE